MLPEFEMISKPEEIFSHRFAQMNAVVWQIRRLRLSGPTAPICEISGQKNPEINTG
jgi:hypothetical protein